MLAVHTARCRRCNRPPPPSICSSKLDWQESCLASLLADPSALPSPSASGMPGALLTSAAGAGVADPQVQQEERPPGTTLLERMPT